MKYENGVNPNIGNAKTFVIKPKKDKDIHKCLEAVRDGWIKLQFFNLYKSHNINRVS
jgi:hypothetical protein